jgi:hypothetical protein
MSTGTKLIQNALKKLGVFSIVKPTNPEQLEDVKDSLNSMLARWQDDGIECGAVPLNAIGDDFSEPLGLTNVFEDNLAIEVQPYFESAKISTRLLTNANKGYQDMLTKYRSVTIPKLQARSTLPKGQGNRHHRYDNTFFDAGEEIG